jgi:predicted acyltransferase
MYTIKVPYGDEMVGLSTYLFNNLFLSWLEPINASLLWAIVYILVWLGLMWILYARKIFIKV